MRHFFVLLAFGFCSSLFAADKPVASGPLKAFKGPEGEVITMVEVNDSKQILVHFKGVGGEIEDKMRLYTLNDMGNGKKEITYTKKRGSKTETRYVMTYRDGHWTFNGKGTTHIQLDYSEKHSEAITVDQFLKRYNP